MPSNDFYVENIDLKIKERRAQIDIFNEKISKLRKNSGYETREEERFRLDNEINQSETKRDELYFEIEELEKSLSLHKKSNKNTFLSPEGVAAKGNKKIAILLAINPIKIKEDDLKETVHKLKESFKEAQHLDISYKLELDYEKIQDFLKEKKPNIVHFIGYDNEIEKITLKIGEYAEIIGGELFRKLFENSGVECVILNYNYNPQTINGVTKELQGKVK